MSTKTVVVTARVDTLHLAELAFELQKEWGVILQSKSQLIRFILQIAAQNLVKERKFEDSDSAFLFLRENGLIDGKRSRFQELVRQTVGKGNWDMGVSALETARSATSLDIDEEEYREMFKKAKAEVSSSQSKSKPASTKQDRVLRQGREPELADAEAEYEQELTLITVQAQEEDWDEGRCSLEREAAMERLKRKRREINDRYPVGKLPSIGSEEEKE